MSDSGNASGGAALSADAAAVDGVYTASGTTRRAPAGAGRSCAGVAALDGTRAGPAPQSAAGVVGRGRRLEAVNPLEYSTAAAAGSAGGAPGEAGPLQPSFANAEMCSKVRLSPKYAISKFSPRALLRELPRSRVFSKLRTPFALWQNLWSRCQILTCVDRVKTLRSTLS